VIIQFLLDNGRSVTGVKYARYGNDKNKWPPWVGFNEGALTEAKLFESATDAGGEHDKADNNLEQELHNQFAPTFAISNESILSRAHDKQAQLRQSARTILLVRKRRLMCFVEFKADGGRLTMHRKRVSHAPEAEGTPTFFVTKRSGRGNEISSHVPPSVLPWTPP